MPTIIINQVWQWDVTKSQRTKVLDLGKYNLGNKQGDKDKYGEKNDRDAKNISIYLFTLIYILKYI